MLQTEKGSDARRGKRRGIAAFAGAIVLALALSACGNGTNAKEGAGQSAPAAQEESQTQTVKHAYGETEVPLHPKRVAVIGLEDLTLSLGAPMVYAYGFDGYYLEDQLEALHISLSGSADLQPNLEKILATQPDLIILQRNFTDEKGYADLSKIAPTIAYAPDDWKSTIIELGQVLGLEDKAQETLKAYDEKLRQAKESIVSAAGPDKTVIFMRPSASDLQVFFPSFKPLIYDDLGLKPDASIETFRKKSPDDWGINTSLEELPSITADYVFSIYGGSISTAKDFAQSVAESAGVEKLKLWQEMPAVKQNHAFKVSARTWMSSGPIAEGKVIDDVVAAVTGKQQ